VHELITPLNKIIKINTVSKCNDFMITDDNAVVHYTALPRAITHF